MKKLPFLAAVALAAIVTACGETESAIKKYMVDYYPEVRGTKIAEVKSENDFASTSERILFYNNPNTTRLLEIADSGMYNISVDLTAVAHCVSAYGQGACFCISPLICLYAIDSICVSDSIYVDNSLSDSVYVGSVLYVRDSFYSHGNLYINNSWSVNTSKEELYAGEVMNVTTLTNTNEMVDINAVSMSKSVIHAVDKQLISVSKDVLVSKHGAAYVTFEIASHIHNAQCYASSAAGGVGYSVIYIEPTNETGKMATSQMLFQN
ncbi:MAG: hypothetical protein LBF67_07055 [Prevotellaceae bacterium]|jgi:hypothetical protein|nr:hypothetical protein [Prevotellaceae bacterium]